MDFRIRNGYIKKFLSNYANQNELKVIKYLTILGINTLEKLNKRKPSYFELKSMAKDILKLVPKEDKEINKELKIIKNELAKLNEKFADKIKTSTPQKQQENKEVNYARSTSAPRNYDARMLTRKPPSTWREGDKENFMKAEMERRANSNEPIQYPEFSETQQRKRPINSSVTLKPNEVAFPRVNPLENRNRTTRHHLDDTEARTILNEEGVIYFPERDKENKHPNQVHSSQQNKAKYPQSAKQETRNGDEKKSFQGNMPNNRAEENQHDESTRSDRGEGNKSKSPHFYNKKEAIKEAKSYDEEEMDLKNPAQNTFAPSQNKRESRNERKFDKEESSKLQQHKLLQDKVKSRSKMSRSKLNQTQVEPPRYQEVQSKIKDDINYHKELSRQQKKMKEHTRQYENYDDISVTSSQRHYGQEKSEVVDHHMKEGMYKHRQSQQSSRYQSGYYDNSKLLDSGSSVAKSINMQRSSNHLLDKNGDYTMSATKHRRTENNGKNEDISYYKSIVGENQGGILDIANSFLNSPLMQHLSNIDSKHSEDSSKASSPTPEHSKQLFNVRVTTFDSKSPLVLPKSPAKKYDVIEESRRLEPHSSQIHPSHQHKYSDWVGVYKTENGIKTNQSTVLKDSDNRRYAEYASKDSRMLYNKDDDSSSTSSAFSNFINDDMQFFFRKETYELNKMKNSKSLLKQDDSEVSSNTSYRHHEVNRTVGGGNTHSRKITHHHDNNKSYNGLPLDNVNIFHNERMSVTRYLNNS